MGKNTRFVGLDVHAETIAVAVAEGPIRCGRLALLAIDRRRCDVSWGSSAS